MSACGRNADSRAAEVFSFADDDLCEWISEAEVAAFVREAYAQSGVAWDRSAAATEPSGSAWDLPGRDYCRWVPAGDGHVIARGLAPSQFGPVREFSEVADNDGVLLHAVRGHPQFADGIIAASAAFGRYGFWLEGSDEVLGLEAAFEHGDPDDWAQHEKMLFHVAESFLTEMGWTS